MGLPLCQAATRCPAAVVRRAQPAQVAQAVRLLRGVLDRFSPRVARQQQGADVALIADLELPACRRHWRWPRVSWLRCTRRCVSALRWGWPPPQRWRIWLRGSPVPGPPSSCQWQAGGLPSAAADRLAAGSPAIAERSRLFGLRTIGAVARLPRDALEAQFGIIDGALHDLAHGRDQASLWVAPSVAQVGVRRHFAGAVLHARVVLAATWMGRGSTGSAIGSGRLGGAHPHADGDAGG